MSNRMNRAWLVMRFDEWSEARTAAEEYANTDGDPEYDDDEQDRLDGVCDEIADDILWELRETDVADVLDMTVRELRGGLV